MSISIACDTKWTMIHCITGKSIEKLAPIDSFFQFIYSCIKKRLDQTIIKEREREREGEREVETKSSFNLARIEIDFRELNASSTRLIITGIVTRSTTQQWSQKPFRDSHSKRFLPVETEKKRRRSFYPPWITIIDLHLRSHENVFPSITIRVKLVCHYRVVVPFKKHPVEHVNYLYAVKLSC